MDFSGTLTLCVEVRRISFPLLRLTLFRLLLPSFFVVCPSAAAAAAIQLPPGFQASLFAAEPKVQNSIRMRAAGYGSPHWRWQHGSPDVLRPNYSSMIMGNFLCIGEASLRAGNSKTISWSDYLDLVDLTEICSFLETTLKRS